MKLYILLIAVCLLLSCSNNVHKRERFNYNTSSNPWIVAYKDNVFYECLKEGYKNDSIYNLMLQKDLFNPYNEIPFSQIDSARVLGRKIILNMPPAIFCDDCEVTGKNYISANCLHYYASFELDSIARLEYKKYINGKQPN